jgi:quercetin dioxygenase-like cupin family protein
MTVTTTGHLRLQATEPAESGREELRPRRRFPALPLVCIGLVAALAATAGIAVQGHSPASAEATAPVSVDEPAVVRPSDVEVIRVEYAPGQSSGWHTHPGIHAVAVLSGQLTVYGSECTPRTFGPGDSYVGGQELHLARNETGSPVEMVVTAIEPTQPANSVTRRGAPEACAVG